MNLRGNVLPSPPAPSATTPENRRVIVIQDGARLHYAIPLALQHAGVLEQMYTTWYSQPGSIEHAMASAIRLINKPLGRKMLDRHADGLDYRKVVSLRSITWQERRIRKQLHSEQKLFEWVSQQVSQRVQHRGWGHANTLFGFIRNIHPDLCRAAREAGLQTIGDQMIAPGEIELAEERLQRERFPEWSNAPLPKATESCVPFEQATWPHLDHFTCASTYVRDGLVQQGIASERITVIPYPINANEFPAHDRSNRKGPIVVGFVGAVGLRKGAPYFAQVAKRLTGRNIRFVMVGPVHLAESIQPEVRKHVELIGPVPRSEVRRWLEKFDLYFFPSTCEGSAGSVMEAMASGLPIVTSPNAGSIVEHNLSGYIHDYSNIDAFAQAIEALASNEAQRLAMGRAARLAVEKCSIASFSDQWKALLAKLTLSTPTPK